MKLTSHQKNLLDNLGYIFKNEDFFKVSLTHSSMGKTKDINNQRLEFLGDRVLGLVIAEKLLNDNKEAKEGYLAPQLNSLVKKETCAEVASKINLGPALIMSRSESSSGGRKKVAILGDAMEAILGAIYLDGGLEKVRKIIYVLWQDAFSSVIEKSFDPKSALQEWAQANEMCLPKYTEKNRSGPAHAPTFFIEVSLKNGMSKVGASSSKRNAEQLAAAALLKLLEEKPVGRK